jgi:molecular chaperone DnaK (HSP70)
VVTILTKQLLIGWLSEFKNDNGIDVKKTQWHLQRLKSLLKKLK